MHPKVSIIDYGMGNIYSIKCALKSAGIESVLTNSAKEIKKTQGIILPGVGAFPEAMKRLKKDKIPDVIYEFNDKKKLIIGICLGMQLLFEKSAEIKETQGLSLIKGRVKKFNSNCLNVGWSQIILKKMKNKKKNFLDLSLNKKSMYFIHSYHSIPEDREIVSSTSKFKNESFVSSLSSDNIKAFQFHPEKSGKNGVKIYKEILKDLEI